MNLQTEEIEFENQLVDISPMEIHLKKFKLGLSISGIFNGSDFRVESGRSLVWDWKGS